MEDYLIQPWDTEEGFTGINLDMWVPPEIDELAQRVIGYYEMEVHSKTLITTKSDKGGAIWKIETDKGPRSLKLLHRKPIRSLFSVGAQDYIVKQGGRIPELVTTKEGLLYVEQGGKLWIVTDWIESLTPASKDLLGAQALCYGLGEFHRHSRGYTPPPGSQRASRLYRWPAYYQKIVKKIGWFRNVAKAYSEIPSSQTLLSIIDIFEQQALDSLSLLEQSSYTQMISRGEEHWGLVHQDYGWSNGQLGTGGLWVIDLDGVSYDLPIRDLRKLISSSMDDLGRWDVPWIQGMISAYHEANPLDLETYEILLNDLAFPNEFYKHINEMLYDPIEFLTNDLDRILLRLTLLEKTKGLALAELILDKEKFQTGHYDSNTEFDLKKPEKMQIKAMTEKIIVPNLLSKTLSPYKKKIFPMNEEHKLKVLMICTEKLPVPPVRGGAIQTYIEGISGLLSQRHDLTILGTTDPTLPLEEYRNNVRYVRIDGEHVLEIYASKVIDFLQKESFDLIHVFNRPRLIPLIREVAPYSRLILSMHNDMFGSNKIHPQDALTAIKEVEQIVTVSDYVGKTISSLYPQATSKVHTIYSGVDLKMFIPWKTSKWASEIRQKLRSDYQLEDKTVILFVGRLTPKKGTDLLIQAINELSLVDSNIALVIVGGTWYSVDVVTDYVAYVRALAERAPFPVITTGYVASDLIHQWFWAGDIFVCPSQWQEPLARVHYEAMAAGLPFLTTARGGNPEVVIDGNGLLVERPEDSIEFAEKLKILLTNSKLRSSMGQTGRRIAEERFSWERVANEVLETWTQKFAFEAEPENEIAYLDADKVKDEVKDKVKDEVKDKVKDEVKDKDKDKDKGKTKTKTKRKPKEQELDIYDKELVINDKELEEYYDVAIAGSCVVKVTRDMIVMRASNSSTNLTVLSFGKSLRNLIVPTRVNYNPIDLICPSVVKITREMIVY